MLSCEMFLTVLLKRLVETQNLFAKVTGYCVNSYISSLLRLYPTSFVNLNKITLKTG